jgi:redox-sensitive bicupin YhaK (pirin superfamily)
MATSNATPHIDEIRRSPIPVVEGKQYRMTVIDGEVDAYAFRGTANVVSILLSLNSGV